MRITRAPTMNSIPEAEEDQSLKLKVRFDRFIPFPSITEANTTRAIKPISSVERA